jgi:GNAT superfamily N-acetyltransferase
MSLILREITADDFVRWLPLWEGYNAFYGRSGPTALPAAVTRATWERFLDSKESMHALVAESDGALVGIAHYLFHRSTTSSADVCYLQDLFTDPSVRGRGIGEALVRAVQARAKASGAARLYWHTHESNATARKLYDRLAERSGFIVYRMAIERQLDDAYPDPRGR